MRTQEGSSQVRHFKAPSRSQQCPWTLGALLPSFRWRARHLDVPESNNLSKPPLEPGTITIHPVYVSGTALCQDKGVWGWLWTPSPLPFHPSGWPGCNMSAWLETQACGWLSLGTRGPQAQGRIYLGCWYRREGGHDPTAIPWQPSGDGVRKWIDFQALLSHRARLCCCSLVWKEMRIYSILPHTFTGGGEMSEF